MSDVSARYDVADILLRNISTITVPLTRQPLVDLDEVAIQERYGLHWLPDETADEFRKRVEYVTGGAR